MILVILTPNPKKIDFGGWCGKKNTRVVFAVPDTSDVLEWKTAFKKRSKPFGSVLELKKAFWSGNNRSGVLFLLNLAKLIDFGFGVEIYFHDQGDPGIITMVLTIINSILSPTCQRIC